MARCALNVSHPKFKKIVDKYITGHPDFYKCLDALCGLVLKDHKLSGWVNHPMPGFPAYQNRVWKWDFKPSAIDQSGTRKGWRIFALAEHSNSAAHPTPATAFFCYDKDNEPKGNPATWISQELKNFLREEAASLPVPDETFRHFPHGEGKTISLCLVCCETIFISDIEAEIQMAEASHQCAN